jgi:putative ATPase
MRMTGKSSLTFRRATIKLQTMDLFESPPVSSKPVFSPLADRMRPERLDDLVGQESLTGKGRVLRTLIENDEPMSMVFWGPPGVGKTTLARIVAHETKAAFFSISAVTAGVQDLRKIMEQARTNRKALGKRTILFIDEIHRFNKAQQDALLHSVEDGTLIFIGATTENPSFEVIAPLLSRCRVFRLEPLTGNDLAFILRRALEKDALIKSMNLEASGDSIQLLVGVSGGDARTALNALELCGRLAKPVSGRRTVTPELVKEAMQKQTLMYDKQGDFHYDTISAFIKSMRSSDPDAAVYWMARMLESGEDPLFIARRMLILASEDVGNADPQALVLANAAFQAVHSVGMPEARIILSQAATYLASAPKSNAAYTAVSEASEDVRNLPPEPVPLHLRNAVTGLMKSMDYGEGYKYAHDFEDGFPELECLPSRLKDRIYYRPKEIGEEKNIKARLERLWKKRQSKKE